VTARRTGFQTGPRSPPRARRRRIGPTTRVSTRPQKVMPLLPGVTPTRSKVNKQPLGCAARRQPEVHVIRAHMLISLAQWDRRRLLRRRRLPSAAG
jgi:hypothetical protein